MPVVVIETAPVGVPIEAVDAVFRSLGVESDPPPGMIFHVTVDRGGRAQHIDVWETEDHYRRFETERVQPAVERVRASRGAANTPQQPPEAEVLRVVNLAIGRR
jgi:hypothetical protein